MSAQPINPALLGIMRVPDPAPAASATKSSSAPLNLLPAVPQILKDIPNWVAWKMAPSADGKLTKVPFIVGSNFQRKAKSSDSATWTDFNTAVASTELNHVQGIGFVVGGRAIEAGLIGVDIDGCRNPETGEITDWADEIVQQLVSYTEITPSETGVRVWLIGKLVGDEKMFKLDPSIGYGDKVQIEIYDSGRYFTVTGDPLFEEPADIESRDLTPTYQMIRGLAKKHPLSKTAATSDTLVAAATYEYESVLLEMIGPGITSKFDVLMRGQISSEKPFVISDGAGRLQYKGRSEADQSLCTLLAMQHGDDPDAIWNAYEDSALFRDKWEHREDDFRKGTIAKAIKSAEKIRAASAAKVAASSTASAALISVSNDTLAQALGFTGDMNVFDRQSAITQLAKTNHPLVAGVSLEAIPAMGYAPLEFKYPAVQGTEFDFVLGAADTNTEGWFPRGDPSLIGGPSGGNKTTLMLDLLDTQLKGQDYLGHKTFGLPYLVIGVDRGAKAQKRTAARMRYEMGSVPTRLLQPGLTGDAAVHGILREIEGLNPLPAVVFIEGCDLLLEDASKMHIVAPFLNALQKIAEHYHIAIVCSLGTPKMKKGEGYEATRDKIYGTVAWGRMTETILLLSFEDGDDTKPRRSLVVQLRNGPTEKYDMEMSGGRLVIRKQGVEEGEKVRKDMAWMETQGDWFTAADLAKVAGYSLRRAEQVTAELLTKRVLKTKQKKSGEVRVFKWNNRKGHADDRDE